MRSFITLIALAAAASAATSQLTAREEAQTCAMKTLLSSSACNTGDAACLCSDATRNSVMQEIKAACGSEQSESTDKLAADACHSQKMRRAVQPSDTVVHNALATPSSSAAARVNGAQQGSDGQACTCANTPANAAEGSNTDSPSTNGATPQGSTPQGSTANGGSSSGSGSGSGSGSNSNTGNDESNPVGSSPSSAHRNTTPSGTDNSESPAQSSHVHAPSNNAAAASSSAARHGAAATPSSSASAHATPSGADAFSSFQGAGAQVIPSMTVVAGGVLAGIIGVFAAM